MKSWFNVFEKMHTKKIAVTEQVLIVLNAFELESSQTHSTLLEAGESHKSSLGLLKSSNNLQKSSYAIDATRSF